MIFPVYIVAESIDAGGIIMKAIRILSLSLCLSMLCSCSMQEDKIEPVDPKPVPVETRPTVTASAEKLLDIDNLGLNNLEYLMVQYVEDNDIYLTAVSESDNDSRTNYLCKYNIDTKSNEVLKTIEGDFVINSFAFIDDALVYSKLSDVIDDDNYTEYTVILMDTEGEHEIDAGLTRDRIGFNTKMRSPIFVKMADKVFYVSEDYQRDREQDIAYGFRFMMLDEGKLASLLSETVAIDKYETGVYNAYDHFFIYDDQIAIIVKETPDSHVVTYDGEKFTEQFFYSSGMQNVYIYNAVNNEIKKMQSNAEVEYNCFVNENTLFAKNMDFKGSHDFYYHIETGQFSDAFHQDIYDALDSWSEDIMVNYYNGYEYAIFKDVKSLYDVITKQPDGSLESRQILFDDMPKENSRLLVINEEKMLMHTMDGIWIINRHNV